MTTKIDFESLIFTSRKLAFAFVLLAACSLTSCVSTKKMIYMQGANDMLAVPQTITQDFEIRIQPDDILYITISSKDEELLAPFSNSKLLGTSTTSFSGVQEAVGIPVDKSGNVQLPILGGMYAAGLTREELANKIKEELVRGEFIKDPVVTIRMKNFKISVLGEVKNPGVKQIMGDRVTVLEALGMAGDLTVYGKRENILVLRETNGQRSSYTIDLTSAESVLKSPCYFLQQNDVVIVEPNKSIGVRGSSTMSYISAGGSIISIVVSIITLIIAANK